MKKIRIAGLLCLSALVFASSCEKDSRYGIPDTGDLRMGVVMPGNESVTICVELKDGSGASKAEVTWGEEGSASFDIPSGGSFQHKIAVPEGSYIFRVSAFDAGGRKVIDFPMSGRSYGASYISGLKSSRVPIVFKLNNDKDVNITWAANPKGCLRTIVTYNKIDESEPITMSVAPGTATSILEKPVLEVDEDGNEVFRFKVMSYYYPDILLLDSERRPESVPANFVFDEFPSATTEYDNGPVDVTSVYIKNAGPDMEYTLLLESDKRWGILKDWQTNAAAKNQGGSTVGGWKGGGIGWEVGWGAASISNGKVWQSPTLPEGTYELTIGHGGVMDLDIVELYLVAAEGSELPDVADLESGSLSYMHLIEAGGERSIIFKLTESKQVSLGILINTTEGAAWVDAASWIKLVDLKQYDE